MKKLFVIFVFFSISLSMFALSTNDRDSIFYGESIRYILTNTSQDHPERFDTLCSIILSQYKDIKSIFGESSSEYRTLIQAADFIYTLSHVHKSKPLKKSRELGTWIRKLESEFDNSTYCQLSIATALSDYYNIHKRWKKATYWINVQKELSEQNCNFSQLGNAYVTEAMVATAHKDIKLLYDVINGVLNEKRIPQHTIAIALNYCLIFGYENLETKEIKYIYNTIASKDSLNLQNLLCAADKAAEYNDTTGVNIILGSKSVISLSPEEYIHLYHEVSSFFRESNPNKAIDLLNEAIRYGQKHNRNDLLFEEWNKTYHYYRTIALHYISQLNDRKLYIEYELKNLKEIEFFYGKKSLEYCKTITDIANIMSVYGHSAESTLMYDSISVKSHLDFYGNNSSEYVQSVLSQMGHAKVYHRYDYFWKGANRLGSSINNFNDSLQCEYFNLLGQVYSIQGDNEHAILMYNNAQQKSTTYQERCFITSNLAYLYKKIGNVVMAQKSLKSIIEHVEFKDLSCDMKFLLLDNYAGCLQIAKDKYAVYKKAENYISDSRISIYNKVLHYLNKSRNSPTRIDKLEALKEAKTLCFKEQPRDTMLYVQVLAELGADYGNYGNSKKAIECYEEAYKLIDSQYYYGEENQNIFTEQILSKLTGLYARLGDVEKSQKYANYWLDITIKTCEKGHQYSSTWLYGVCNYLSIDKAAMIYEKYDDILRQHPFYLWGKAYLSERRGLYNEAISLYEECMQDTALVASTLPRLLRLYNKNGLTHKISDIEKQYVSLQNEYLLTQISELSESEQMNLIPLVEGSVVQLLQGIPNLYSSYSVFNHLLFCKGLCYKISSSKRDILSKKKNRSLQKNLRITQDEIVIAKAKKDFVTLQLLEVRKDSLEHLLASNNNLLKLLQSDLLKSSSSSELQKVMKDDELIIDFEKINEGGNIYYKSIVMAKDIPPTIIDLYKEKNDTIFYNNLEPYIKRYKKVYFSPSGSSYVSPLEYILRKKYNNIEFHRIFTLSDIHVDRNLNNFNIIAFGNPSFNADASQTKSQRSTMWQPLPGSQVEIDSITSCIRKHTTGCALQFTGQQATENMLKSLEKNNISILHISTHGYYNPLTNESGLLFTGANRGLNGDVLENTDDGILTCDEIENLNFPNLKLVVLSACDTGLGKTNIDGVWGLQRAFRIAGAKNMIVSLKKVDDELTQSFMINFYKNLIIGKSIYKSFWEAMDKADEDTRNSFILIE